jgi:hypothetical protein
MDHPVKPGDDGEKIAAQPNVVSVQVSRSPPSTSIVIALLDRAMHAVTLGSVASK